MLSSVFLVSYILFHYFVKETTYGGEGTMRYVYYTILISHIILAAGVLPLILLSFHRGLQMQVEKHRKLVKFAFPIWLYVTVTGVIVYIMIYFILFYFSKRNMGSYDGNFFSCLYFNVAPKFSIYFCKLVAIGF